MQLVPALAAAAAMALVGGAAVVNPSVLRVVGVAAESSLGRSEIRAVFGGMFLALGLACLITRHPVAFAVVGAAWLSDFGVRLVAVVIDRVPARSALPVLATAALMGSALLSGYWLA